MTDIDEAAQRRRDFFPILRGDADDLADAHLVLQPRVAELGAEIDAARETINRMGTIISNLEADANRWDYVRRNGISAPQPGYCRVTDKAIDDLIQREPIE